MSAAVARTAAAVEGLRPPVIRWPGRMLCLAVPLEGRIGRSIIETLPGLYVG